MTSNKKISWLFIVVFFLLLTAISMTIFFIYYIFINSVVTTENPAPSHLGTYMYMLHFLQLMLYFIFLGRRNSVIRHRKIIPLKAQLKKPFQHSPSPTEISALTGIFQYSVDTIFGDLVSLSNFHGKRAYLVVNVASQ